MAEYDFHYTPLEGKLPGLQMQKQTEDAINDLGNRIVNIEDDSTEAIEKAEQALNASSNAVEVANDAETKAQQALDATQGLRNTHFIGINSSGPADQNYDGGGATGSNAIAIGKTASSSENSSVAVGNLAMASHQNSVAIGSNSVTDINDAISVGKAASGGIAEYKRRIMHVADGIDDSDAITKGQIKNELASRAVWCDNVASLRATNLTVGMVGATKGYYSPNDGGASVYTIRAKTAADVDDGGKIIFLNNGNVAELVTDGTVNVKQYGAAGDGVTDDTRAIQQTIDDNPQHCIYFPDGTYIVSETIGTSRNQAKYSRLYLSRYAVIKASDTFSDEWLLYIGKNGTNYDPAPVTRCDFTGGVLDCNGRCSGIYARGQTTMIYDTIIRGCKMYGIQGYGKTYCEEIYVEGPECATGSIGLIVDHTDTVNRRVRTYKFETGIQVNAASTVFEGCHPFYHDSVTDAAKFQTGVGFDINAPRVFLTDCYSDNFATAIKINGSHSVFSVNFELYYLTRNINVNRYFVQQTSGKFSSSFVNSVLTFPNPGTNPGANYGYNGLTSAEPFAGFLNTQVTGGISMLTLGASDLMFNSNVSSISTGGVAFPNNEAKIYSTSEVLGLVASRSQGVWTGSGILLGAEGGTRDGEITLSAEGTDGARQLVLKNDGTVTWGGRDVYLGGQLVVNVKDYGATGDGVTDDTEAIKDAIAENKQIFFPAGTYIVTEPIGIPSNVWIRGAGKGATIIKTDDATDAIYHTICTSNAVAITARSATNSNVDTLCPEYVDYAKLSDMTIDGNAYNRPDVMRHASPYNGYEAGTAVEFQRCRNCEIVNVEVINGPQHNINVRAGAGSYNQGNTFVAKYPSQYVTIDGCNTDNEMLDDAITTHDSEYIYINNCQAFLTRNTSGTNTTPVSNGIEIDDGSRYVWVTNCLSDGGICGYQTKGHANTPPAHHVWFINCVARNNHFGFAISTGTAVTTEGVLEGTCHDITVDGCKIENVYQKSGMTSWQNECHYISMLGAKNVKVHDLNVVGKMEELPDYSTNDRCAYFRHRDFCENIIYENVHITEADYNITTNRPLFSFEAYTKRLYLRQIFCDSYTTGSIVNYTSNSILECKDINVLTTSSTYVPITVNSLNNTLVERVAFGGNTVAVNSGNFYEQDNVVANNSITAPLNNTTAVPLRLVGALDRTETTVPVGRSVALRFGLTDNAGNIVNEALVAARTRAASPYTDPGSAGTNLSFYVRDTNGTLTEQTILNSTTLMPYTDNVMSLGLSTNRWNTLYTYGIDMNNFRLDVNSSNKLRFNGDTIALEKDYLPLAGGTLTGDLDLSLIKNSQQGDAVRITGGQDIGPFTGAMLTLFHKNAANAGYFRLFANDGTNTNTLEGRPNGTLTWGGQPIQTSSDKRLKTDFADVPADVLEAWGKVEWKQFKYLADKKNKGKTCRIHTGLVAQDVSDVSKDIMNYGILCYDRERDLWTIRYEEALAMEAIYLRNEIKKLRDEIKASKEK